MAINPKDLEDLKPSSAVDRLKARKTRIKPWQTPAPDDSSLESASANANALQESKPLVEALAAPPLNAATPLPSTIQFSNSEASSPENSNTDTEPTQYRHAIESSKSDRKAEYRHKADTDSNGRGISLSSNTDTVPTHPQSQIGHQLAVESVPLKSTDTKPTQKAAEELVSSQKSRHSTDTKSTSGITAPESSTDTVPAQYQHNADTTAAEGLKSRHKSGRVPTQSRHNTDTSPNTKPAQWMVESRHSTDTEPTQLEQKFRILRGHKFLLMEYCVRQSLAAISHSFHSSYENLAAQTKIPLGSIRTTAKRLKADGLIEIKAPCKGPGAFVELVLPDEMVRFLARGFLTQAASTDTEPAQPVAESRHNTDTRSDTNPSSKLVSTKNLLPSEEGRDDRFAGFDQINLAPLANFGIHRKHIQDIKNQKLEISLPQLEEFILRFSAFASVPENVRKVSSFPGLFISMVRKLSFGEDPLPGFETEQDKWLRETLERRKREKADSLKLESELREFDFEDWFTELTATDKDTIAPPQTAAPSGSASQKQLIRAHFAEVVWPDRKAQAMRTLGS